ncbi:MAG: hypothetical protein Q9160_002480 [Pyrenula sp. 1 TL-2023]
MGQIPRNLLATTQKAIDIYLLSKEPCGSIKGIGYWQVANGYTAIALHDLWSGSLRYKSVVESALQSIDSTHPNFINEFNDDTLWWALASIAAYYAYGHDNTHLKRARNVHRHVAKYVVKRGEYEVHGMDMEGGVFWTSKPNEQNINAITTGLFAELSAELAVLGADERIGVLAPDVQFPPQPGSHYLPYAWLSLKWIERCRLSDHIVSDTVKVRDRELIDWIFTYNTGQCIGACTAILKSLTECGSDRAKLLHFACHLAEAAMNRPDWHEIDGALTESGAYGPQNHKAYENDDAVGFKSILVRNLAKLYAKLEHLPPTEQSDDLEKTRAHIHDYLVLQFNTVQTNDVNEISQYGPWWAGPLDLPTSHSQMAILDVMAAIYLVKAGNQCR